MTQISLPEDQTALLYRIETLEVRLSFVDDLVESLNDTVATQAQQLQMQQKQLKMIYQLLQSGQSEQGVEAFNPLTDIPPHY